MWREILLSRSFTKHPKNLYPPSLHEYSVFTLLHSIYPYLQSPSAFATAVDNLKLNEGRNKRDRIVFHSIRHSVATRLARRLGTRDLMDVMEWRTVQMAMRYVHANEDAKLTALSMLGAIPETGKMLPFHKAEMQ